MTPPHLAPPYRWTPPAGHEALYGSARLRDDLAWAAAWLCRAALEAGSEGYGITPTSTAACVEAASLWMDAGSPASEGGGDEYFRDAVSWAAVFPLASLMLRDLRAGGPVMVNRYEAHIGLLLDR